MTKSSELYWMALNLSPQTTVIQKQIQEHLNTRTKPTSSIDSFLAAPINKIKNKMQNNKNTK